MSGGVAVVVGGGEWSPTSSHRVTTLFWETGKNSIFKEFSWEESAGTKIGTKEFQGRRFHGRKEGNITMEEMRKQGGIGL